MWKKNRPKLPVLDLYQGVSLEEAQQALEQTEEAFEWLKTRYTTGLRRLQFWLSRPDKALSLSIAEVTIPLAAQDVVREEYEASKRPESAVEVEDTIYRRTTDLMFRNLDMQCDYVGTGAKRIGTPNISWRD